MKVTRLSWDGESPSIAALVRGLVEPVDEASAIAAEVIAEVRAGGDEALLGLCERFDGARPSPLVIEGDALRDARDRADREVVAALRIAIANVRAVAEAQIGGSEATVEPGQGQRVTVRSVALASAAIYAPEAGRLIPRASSWGWCRRGWPGSSGSSSQRRRVPAGRSPTRFLPRQRSAGADCVYAAGGAQVIAALAYGTESVQSVDLIAGPGGPVVQSRQARGIARCRN